MNLSPENEQYMRGLVERGLFQSIDRAVDEAVSLMRKRDVLRSEVGRALEQARQGGLLTEEEVFGPLEARAREIENAARGQS